MYTIYAYMTADTEESIDEIWDIDRPSIIYCVNHWGFSMAKANWVSEEVSPIRDLVNAVTWGEVLALTKPDWLERLVECVAEEAAEKGTKIVDETPFHVADLGITDEADVLDSMVVPWDAESLYEWFPHEDMDIIATHCRVSGASPGGNIDTYTPKDVQALLTDLRERGYTVNEKDFISDLFEGLSALIGPHNNSW